jgi:high affinity Mn2+ porin
VLVKPPYRPALALLAFLLAGCADEYGARIDSAPPPPILQTTSYFVPAQANLAAIPGAVPQSAPAPNIREAEVISGDANGPLRTISFLSDQQAVSNASMPGMPGAVRTISFLSDEPEGKKANGDGAGNGKKDQEDKDKDKEKDKEDKCKLLPEGWNFHAQTTLIPSLDPGFGAKYSGPNSLSPEAQRTGTISADLFLGAPLWHGAEFHADLLVWQGFGLSSSFGLEAFPDNDAYKAGTVDPRFMMAQFFVRQTIGLGGEQEDVPDGSLTLPGTRDVSRLTITAGRLSLTNIFDNNTYNHDPHTQFMSWAATNLSWDFPADTIGFTTGIAIELNQPDWAVRFGWFQLPGLPNGFTGDDRIFMWPVEPGEITTDGEFWKQWGMILELERRWRVDDHPGAIRLQTWLDHGYLASYRAATALLLASPPLANTPQGVEVDVPAAAFGFHFKYGFGVNWEQEISKNVGIFGRLGWQDGQTAPAAFDDADWMVQLGVSVKGAAWRRPGDTFGLVGNLVGASSQQQAFLKAGGQGILNGDGNLSYTPEMSLETYYDIAMGNSTHLAFDYQFFANPAFNSDRGPVNVFQARLHWEY